MNISQAAIDRAAYIIDNKLALNETPDIVKAIFETCLRFFTEDMHHELVLMEEGKAAKFVLIYGDPWRCPRCGTLGATQISNSVWSLNRCHRCSHDFPIPGMEDDFPEGHCSCDVCATEREG